MARQASQVPQGSMVGPPVAGVVADTVGWRWVFLGVVVLAAAAISVRLVAPGSASVADVHLEQESAASAVIRTAEFTHRVIIDVEPERTLSSPRRAA